MCLISKESSKIENFQASNSQIPQVYIDYREFPVCFFSCGNSAKNIQRLLNFYRRAFFGNNKCKSDGRNREYVGTYRICQLMGPVPLSRLPETEKWVSCRGQKLILWARYASQSRPPNNKEGLRLSLNKAKYSVPLFGGVVIGVIVVIVIVMW